MRYLYLYCFVILLLKKMKERILLLVFYELFLISDSTQVFFNLANVFLKKNEDVWFIVF